MMSKSFLRIMFVRSFECKPLDPRHTHSTTLKVESFLHQIYQALRKNWWKPTLPLNLESVLSIALFLSRFSALLLRTVFWPFYKLTFIVNKINVVHYLKYVSDHNFCLTLVLVSDDWSQWSLSEGCFTQVKQGFKLIHGEISPGCFFDCKASCIGMLHTSLFAWQSLHKHLPWKLYGKIIFAVGPMVL